jgi:hypothetical protein
MMAQESSAFLKKSAKVFLVTFFLKRVTSSVVFAFEKMDCFASLAMTGCVAVTSSQF